MCRTVRWRWLSQVQMAPFILRLRLSHCVCKYEIKAFYQLTGLFIKLKYSVFIKLLLIWLFIKLSASLFKLRSQLQNWFDRQISGRILRLRFYKQNQRVSYPYYRSQDIPSIAYERIKLENLKDELRNCLMNAFSPQQKESSAARCEERSRLSMKN